MNEFVKNLRDSVTESKLDEVVEKLNLLFTNVDSELETSLIIVNANRQRLRRQQICGLISDDDYRLEINKITERILKFIEEIQINLDKYLPFINEESVVKGSNEKDIILFYGANPSNFNVDIRKEIDQINEKLISIKKRNLFEFKIKMDVRPKEFEKTILELDKEPRFFHYGGNGVYEHPKYGSGIILSGENPEEVKTIDAQTLGSIFSRLKGIECVFLNACNTVPTGIEISKNIPYVIAMNQYVTDKFGIEFASYFYEAIGAGKNVEYAFNYSIDTLKMQGDYKKEQIETPQLLLKGTEYSFNWHGLTYEEWENKVKPY